MTQPPRHDVLVVGGGLVGASLAIALALATRVAEAMDQTASFEET